MNFYYQDSPDRYGIDRGIINVTTFDTFDIINFAFLKDDGLFTSKEFEVVQVQFYNMRINELMIDHAAKLV